MTGVSVVAFLVVPRVARAQQGRKKQSPGGTRTWIPSNDCPR